MGKKKRKSPVWVTALGQSSYETVNPYWHFCEYGQMLPNRIVVFYDVAADKLKTQTTGVFRTVSQAYGDRKGPISVQAIGFDDEDVGGLREKVTAECQKVTSRGQRLILDVSSTTWSFVPVCFSTMAAGFRQHVEGLVYLQYTAHRYRYRPYPLIPRQAVTFHNLHPDTGITP